MNKQNLFSRFSRNPIVEPEQLNGAHSIFNSAIIRWNNGYIGIFRVDDQIRNSRLHLGHSPDGISWDINETPFELTESRTGKVKMAKGYDPRITRIDNRYYVTWCNDCFGPSICMAYTDDFEVFNQIDMVLPANRNAVLFPKKINGLYTLLTRPTDNSMQVNFPFDSIFCFQSPDLTYWGKSRLVMSPRPDVVWEYTKIGAGPVPLEVEEGWLLIYHGVLNSCSGSLYQVGGAILDREEPWKVLYRSRKYLMAPRENYERVGDVPNVVFPTAVTLENNQKTLRMYYGGADTCTCAADAEVAEVIEFIKKNS